VRNSYSIVPNQPFPILTEMNIFVLFNAKYDDVNAAFSLLQWFFSLIFLLQIKLTSIIDLHFLFL
jgi:hypothetical protein